MFEALLNAFRAPDLRRRILYVAGILMVFRLLAHVPVPGVDAANLREFLDTNPIFGLLDLFSGGGLSNFSVVALGVNPYINASIIMQLMTGVVPSLQALQREGEYGRQKINQYTRYLAVPMALLQAYGFLALLSANSVLSTPFDLGSWETITQIITLTAGSVVLMWLGELITEKGIGNGISFIIFAGIVSQRPGRAPAVHREPGPRPVRAVRRARHRGRRGDHLHPGGPAPDPDPVRLARARPAHVPGRPDVPAAAGQPGRRHPDHLRGQHPAVPEPDRELLRQLAQPRRRHRRRGSSRGSSPGSWLYVVLYFLLTFGFTYFYTAFTFKPDETAEQLRKNGGFIPGIRPGRPTQDYLARVVTRITVAGALFLGLVAASPPLVGLVQPDFQNIALGGTGLLIVVSVVVETMKQLEAQLLIRQYEGFIR